MEGYFYFTFLKVFIFDLNTVLRYPFNIESKRLRTLLSLHTKGRCRSGNPMRPIITSLTRSPTLLGTFLKRLSSILTTSYMFFSIITIADFCYCPFFVIYTHKRHSCQPNGDCLNNTFERAEGETPLFGGSVNNRASGCLPDHGYFRRRGFCNLLFLLCFGAKGS